jgi:hypothetical protein
MAIAQVEILGQGELFYKEVDSDGNPTGELINHQTFMAMEPNCKDFSPDALRILGYCHFDDNDSIAKGRNQLFKIYKVSGYQKRPFEVQTDMDGNSYGGVWDGWFENTFTLVEMVEDNESALTDESKAIILNTMKLQEQKLFRENVAMLLRLTDWQAMSDTPTMSTAMKNWRQALRDMTDQAGFDTPFPTQNCTWPACPEIPVGQGPLDTYRVEIPAHDPPWTGEE